MKLRQKFREEDLQRIKAAVKEAERKISGEIVPVIVTSSARYTEIELLGLVVGLFSGIVAE